MNRKVEGLRNPPAIPLLYRVFLIIFLSRIVWYDLRTITAALSESSDLVLYFTIWSVFLLPFLSYYIIKGFRLEKYYWLPNGLLLLAFYSTVTGMLWDNSLNYILQDLYKFLFIPAVIYATYSLPGRISTSSILTFTASTILFYYCIRIVIFLFFNSAGRVYYGTPQDLFAVCVNLAILLSFRKNLPISKTIGKLGFMSVLSIIGQKKTIAIGLVFLFMMAIVKSVLRVNVRLLLLLSFFLVLTGGTVFWLTSTSSIDVNRYINADVQNELGEDSSRRIEVAVALDALGDSELGYVVGLGGGVVFNVPRIYDGRLVVATTHSMHNTIVTQLSRYGVFGGLAYGSILLIGLFWIIRNRNSNNVERAMLVNVAISYKVVAFMASFVIYGVMDDILLGLIAGLILRFSQFDSQSQRRSE